MENEVRYYLEQILQAMTTPHPQAMPDEEGNPVVDVFKPTHLVLATRATDGTVNITIITEDILNRVKAILDSHDADMISINDPTIEITNLMLV